MYWNGKEKAAMGFWGIVYHFILSLWIGGIALFTFVLTPAIFTGFERDMAGQIVGRLFPGYFLLLLVLSVAALVAYLMPLRIPKPGFRVSLSLLVLALAINLFVSLKLHPEIRSVKAEIRSFETVPADSPLRARFRTLHAVSSVLNLLLLADGSALLVISLLGKR